MLSAPGVVSQNVGIGMEFHEVICDCSLRAVSLPYSCQSWSPRPCNEMGIEARAVRQREGLVRKISEELLPVLVTHTGNDTSVALHDQRWERRHPIES
jgi:hypothetical protein